MDARISWAWDWRSFGRSIGREHSIAWSFKVAVSGSNYFDYFERETSRLDWVKGALELDSKPVFAHLDSSFGITRLASDLLESTSS